MSWLRWWEGTVTDPKWRVVAARAKRPVGDVIAVWAFLLEEARRNDGALPQIDSETIGAALGYDPDDVASIVQAMRDKNSLDDQGVTNWRKRQPKREDDSRERVRQWRDKQRNDACNAPVTHGNAPEAEAEAEAEEKKEVSEASLPRPGQAPRTVKPSLSMDEFWLPYPRTPVMSKQDCAKQWKRLSEADQRKAIDAVAGYKRFLASKPDHPAVHACRFLSQRRFEGFEEDAAKPEATPAVFVPFGSPEWQEWQTINPRKPIQMAAGYGLYFPSKRPQSQSSEAA